MGRRRWPRKIDSQCRVTAHSFLKAADGRLRHYHCTAQTDEIKERRRGEEERRGTCPESEKVNKYTQCGLSAGLINLLGFVRPTNVMVSNSRGMCGFTDRASVLGIAAVAGPIKVRETVEGRRCNTSDPH